MKRLFLFLWSVIALTACSKEEGVVSKEDTVRNVKDVELVLIEADGKRFEVVDDNAISLRKGKLSKVSNYALHFKNEAAYMNAIRHFDAQYFGQPSLRRLLATESIKSNSIVDLPAGFYSLEDAYVEAMKEAESYYERPGGYEQFKAKYSCLYFPEKEGDYSAFRPVSDEAVARLVNPDGYVVVGDRILNKKDIFSYERLKELGLTMPEDKDENRLRSSGGEELEIDGMSPKYNDRKDRKVWVNVKGNRAYKIFEVCFRKKGVLGAWYNYWSETKLEIKHQYPLSEEAPLYSWYEHEIKGYSSHDYVVIMQIQPAVWEDIVIIEYRGIPRKLMFKVRFNTAPDNPR